MYEHTVPHSDFTDNGFLSTTLRHGLSEEAFFDRVNFYFSGTLTRLGFSKSSFRTVHVITGECLPPADLTKPYKISRLRLAEGYQVKRLDTVSKLLTRYLAECKRIGRVPIQIKRGSLETGSPEVTNTIVRLACEAVRREQAEPLATADERRAREKRFFKGIAEALPTKNGDDDDKPKPDPKPKPEKNPTDMSYSLKAKFGNAADKLLESYNQEIPENQILAINLFIAAKINRHNSRVRAAFDQAERLAIRELEAEAGILETPNSPEADTFQNGHSPLHSREQKVAVLDDIELENGGQDTEVGDTHQSGNSGQNATRPVLKTKELTTVSNNSPLPVSVLRDVAEFVARGTTPELQARKILTACESVRKPGSHYTVVWTRPDTSWESDERELTFDEIFDRVPEFLARAERKGLNLFVRVRFADEFNLIQLDECDAATCDKLADVAFATFGTSQDNFQAWLALPEDTTKAVYEDTLARLINKLKLECPDVNKGASGSMRLCGSRNMKPGRDKFPVLVRDVADSRIVTVAKMDSLGFLAAPDTVRPTPARKPVTASPRASNGHSDGDGEKGKYSDAYYRGEYEKFLAAPDFEKEKRSGADIRLAHKCQANGETRAFAVRQINRLSTKAAERSDDYAWKTVAKVYL